MNCSTEEKSLSLEDLIIRILDYKANKYGNSIESIGMFFETKNNLYFFDSGTGKTFKIDTNLYNFLNRLFMVNNKNELEELKKLIEQKNLDIVEILKYIQEEDILKGIEGKQLYNDHFINKVKQEVESNCQQLILELTGACNLRCKYCIYNTSEKQYHSFREFNNESISKTIIKKSIDYMYEHHNKEDTIYISFYGGEPLLRFDLMKYAIEYAKEKLADKKVFYGFTTNMTLMNQEIATYLAQILNLSIICSIDGPEEIHNSNRVYADGKGTYKDVINGLKIFKSELDKMGNHSVQINFNSVYMPPYEKEKLYKIDAYFKELCSITKSSTYTITYPTTGTIPKELEQYDIEDHSMWEYMVENSKKDGFIENSKNKGLLDILLNVHNRFLTQKAHTSISMNGCCIPGARRLYIDTKGDMYVCERVGESPKIGNIMEGINIDTLLDKYIYEYSEHSKKYCYNCWAAKMCPCCYAKRMTRDGISEKAHLDCSFEREYLKSIFSLYYEILEETPDKLSMLNDVVIK